MTKRVLVVGHCKFCNNTFEHNPLARVKQYCCRHCYTEARRKLYIDGGGKKKDLICKQCGNSFRAYVYNDRYFCSTECYSRWRETPANDWRKPGMHRKELRVVICAACNSEFRTKRKYQRYCSRACFLKSPAGRTSRFRKDGRWAIEHDRCVRCGLTKNLHNKNGLCCVCSALLRERQKRGSIGKSCSICGETRGVERAHIVPRKLGGDLSEMNILFLCATHHRSFDSSELYNSEFAKIGESINKAFLAANMDNDGIRFVIPENRYK
jgi:hypothetical protein